MNAHIETKRFGIVRRHVALVWCRAMPRRGSGQNGGTHMAYCQECKRVKRRYWQAIMEVSNDQDR